MGGINSDKAHAETNCTCGRYYGLTKKERINLYLKSIFGPVEQDDLLEPAWQPDLVVPTKQDDLIEPVTNEKTQTPTNSDSKEVEVVNWNILRIIFGLPALAYK